MTIAMKPLPEVRITFSRLLHYGESKRLDLFLNKGDSRLLEADQYEAKAEDYRKAWAEYEEILLGSMTELLGVSFYRPVIDVTLAPFFAAKSIPLIINFRPDPDRFVDVLTHELLHILQTDNNKHQTIGPNNAIDLIAEWQALFGEQEHKTLIHIPLHALHKYLYLDVLHAPERLERDIDSVKRSSTGRAYVKAWDYVNQHDYKDIANQLSVMYAAIGEKVV